MRRTAVSCAVTLGRKVVLNVANRKLRRLIQSPHQRGRGAWADRQAHNLLNGLIDPEQEGRRHFQAKLFSGLQIEMKREPGWLLHRKVAGLGSLEDFNDKGGDLSESSQEARSIRHETAFVRCLRPLVDRGHTKLPRETDNSPS